MSQDRTSLWQHSLRVPSEHVAHVAALVRANKMRIEGFYQGRMESQFHESCRPASILLGEVEERERSVTVHVRHADVRVNVLSEAIANVIPDDLGVLMPRWS